MIQEWSVLIDLQEWFVLQDNLIFPAERQSKQISTTPIHKWIKKRTWESSVKTNQKGTGQGAPEKVKLLETEGRVLGKWVREEGIVWSEECVWFWGKFKPPISFLLYSSCLWVGCLG